jgi:hypothetical protein
LLQDRALLVCDFLSVLLEFVFRVRLGCRQLARIDCRRFRS